jgi:hypothetical protein
MRDTCGLKTPTFMRDWFYSICVVLLCNLALSVFAHSAMSGATNIELQMLPNKTYIVIDQEHQI